jgi:hypothetical protein
VLIGVTRGRRGGVEGPDLDGSAAVEVVRPTQQGVG